MEKEVKVEQRALVFVETEVGKSKQVATALEHCGLVNSVERLTGPYHIVAEAAGQAARQIEGAVIDIVRPIDAAANIVVCLVSPDPVAPSQTTP